MLRNFFPTDIIGVAFLGMSTCVFVCVPSHGDYVSDKPKQWEEYHQGPDTMYEQDNLSFRDVEPVQQIDRPRLVGM